MKADAGGHPEFAAQIIGAEVHRPGNIRCGDRVHVEPADVAGGLQNILIGGMNIYGRFRQECTDPAAEQQQVMQMASSQERLAGILDFLFGFHMPYNIGYLCTVCFRHLKNDSF